MIEFLPYCQFTLLLLLLLLLLLAFQFFLKAEWDYRLSKGLKAPSFKAAISVAPGYDLTNCFLRFDWPYDKLMLHNCQQHFVTQNEKVLREFDSDAVDRALSADSLQGFLEACAPFTGYETAENFYRHCNPVTNIHRITTPCCVFNAKDDPCCKYTNAFDVSVHLPHKGRTYSELVDDSPLGLLVLTNSGSHCPFLDGTVLPFIRDPLSFSEGGTGLMLSSWSDEAALEWFSSWVTEEIEKEE
jgi:predicted alpha/beta-fold hydrolase